MAKQTTNQIIKKLHLPFSPHHGSLLFSLKAKDLINEIHQGSKPQIARGQGFLEQLVAV